MSDRRNGRAGIGRRAGRVLPRAIRAVLLLLAVSACSFLLVEGAPGDPFADVRLESGVSAEALARLRAAHDLDAPLGQRYLRWLGRAMVGDLGRSYLLETPVSTLILARLPNTVLLATTALLAAWIVAVPVGAWTAANPRGAVARCTAALATLLTITPDVALALGAVALAALTGWLPAGGLWSEGTGARTAGDLLRHLLLPALVLAGVQLPGVVRHTESAMRQTLDAPLPLALRARGLGRSRIVASHALRLASAPLATLFGLSLAALLSHSLIVEVVFGWPGLGPLLLDAVLARDAPVVLAAVLTSTVLLTLGTLAGDTLTRALDPRMRAE